MNSSMTTEVAPKSPENHVGRHSIRYWVNHIFASQGIWISLVLLLASLRLPLGWIIQSRPLHLILQNVFFVVLIVGVFRWRDLRLTWVRVLSLAVVAFFLVDAVSVVLRVHNLVLPLYGFYYYTGFLALLWVKWDRSLANLKWFFGTIMGISLGNSILCILEGFGFGGVIYSWLPEYVSNGSILRGFLTEEFGRSLVRGAGLFYDPNFAGSFLALSALISLLVFKGRPVYVRALIFTLLSVGLLATYSRSALLEWGVGICVYLILNKKYKIAGTLLVLGCLGVVYAWFGKDTILALHNGSAYDHILALQFGWHLLRTHAWGVGLGLTGLALSSKWTAVGFLPYVYRGFNETGYLVLADQVGYAGIVLCLALLVGLWKAITITASGKMATVAMTMWLTSFLFLPTVNEVAFTFLVWTLTGLAINQGGNGFEDRVLL